MLRDRSSLAVRFADGIEPSIPQPWIEIFGSEVRCKRCDLPGGKFSLVFFSHNEPLQTRLELDNLSSDLLESAKSSVVRIISVLRFSDLCPLWYFAGEELIVALKEEGSGPQSIADHLGAVVLRQLNLSGRLFLLKLPAFLDPELAARVVGELPSVEFAEANYLQVLDRVGSQIPDRRCADEGRAPTEESQKWWALDRIGALRVDEPGSASVGIAVLDGGIDIEHPDLRANVQATWNAMNGTKDQTPKDFDYHGTACAGLALANGKSNSHFRGVAPGCKLLAIKVAEVTGAGSLEWTTTAFIAEGIEYAWRAGAQVLSLSFFCGETDSQSNPLKTIPIALKSCLTLGRGGRGAVCVAAAGNHQDRIWFPARYSGVIAVGGTNTKDQPKQAGDGEDHDGVWGNNCGPELFISAPSTFIFTTDIKGVRGANPEGEPRGNYLSNFGRTSAATPLVAGGIALLLSRHKGLSLTQISRLLRESAFKVPSVEYDSDGHNNSTGFGRLDLVKLLRISDSDDLHDEPPAR